MNNIKKKQIKKLSDVPYTPKKDKLGEDKKTFTQSLTKDQIKDLLEGYNEVTFENIKPGFNIRYFKKNNDTFDFRMGGMVFKVFDDYVILTNGTTNWSVQKIGNIFFQQVPYNIFKKQIEEDCQFKINELVSLVKSQQKKIKELEDYIRQIHGK